ncbi:uncharacterized protein LOC107983185 isoform X3 [Anolis carolinensis]|uniref:uncharacterized protein LOC107983185 isoform X3 n=1 Tax=Anolis carolinensis TaxID=28377 RepID=UPI002F2B7C44
MAPAQWPLLFLLLLFLVLPRVETAAGDRFGLFCPLAPCWRYWNGNCYCIETNLEGTWTEALRFCKRYKYTELITFTSSEEKDWILDLPLDNFWVGLNNLEETDIFSWSEGTPAHMRLPWLQLSHSIKKNTVYCVKIFRLNLVALNCNTKAHWICKRSADCSFGYFGVNCSSVCSRCYGDELCNPYTGTCDNFRSCKAQDSPAVCERALTSELCPHFSGWKYWESHCYYFSTEPEASWIDARKQCRRFRSTDLMWISSQSEMEWIFSLNASGILWTGLNSRKQKSRWVWSDMKSAAKELNRLRLAGSPFGRCVGLDSVSHAALRLECDKKHKWICKRKEENDLFDVYTDQFLSGPLEPVFYTTLSSALLDCLKQPNCTGIVQDYQYFRRTKGINIIISYDETATSFVRRECNFGYYGYNCASYCKKCYGGFRCNSVTGQCPERMHCIGRFKGELCEFGIKHPKCPQNAPWWFYDGHCYYFEGKMKGQHAWANLRCSYYKDGKLARIDSEKEKIWLGIMVQTESWIGLMQGGTTWKWSGDSKDIDPSKYSWLWDFPSTASGCVQMLPGARFQALPCSEHHSYICEKEIAGLDLFIDYPGKILLAVYPLAMYKDLDEARFHCVLRENCTGISSWPNAHFLVTGMEMVSGSAHHIFRLKTSCSPGHHGHLCSKQCPMCRDSTRCNMVTGFCDEKTTCKDQTSIESCSKSTISERCPDMKTWHYWNRHCYYFSINVGTTWKEANSSCSRFRAAELLWIEDESDVKWITMFFDGRIWLGLQDIDRDHIWAWSHEDSAESALKWMNLPVGRRWRRCTDMTKKGVIHKVSCKKKRGWVCKKPAERDLDVYTGFWDSVVVSATATLSRNYTYAGARDECIKQKSACIGYGLWQNGYFLLNGPVMVGGGFGPSVTFLKSACDYGYYGPDCDSHCPLCHWDKPCHPITGTCELPVVCAVPESVGRCFFGMYNLKCSLGPGWWYWQGKCYLIEKNRKVTWKEAQELCKHFRGTTLLELDDSSEKVWLRAMITEQMWIGMQGHSKKKTWQWGDGTPVNTNLEWLKIEGDTVDSCGTLLKNKLKFQSAKCSEKLYFICARPEHVNIFQEYKGHIIPQRQKTLPKSFYILGSAQEECMYERTACTGVVFSQGKYYAVSGKKIFKSLSEEDRLYLKTVCNPGFFGTNCQFHCKKCINNLPCNSVTGECVGTGLTKCGLDSADPKCIDEVFIDTCPKIPKWYYYSTSCYYVEDSKADTWANARIACQGYKETDLVKIVNSHEKMWVQYKGDDSWIGLTFSKQLYQYFWVDNSSSVFQNAWVVRRNRRKTHATFDCGVAFKKYLSVTDCSHLRKWVCKREKDCAAGRFGERCEHICQKCDDDVSCNPHTGLCGDSLFCNKTDATFTCEKGALIGGRCPTEDGWLYWYGSCYYISGAEIQNWMQAEDMCRKYSGTDLLWITSEDEKKALLSLLPRGVYWTGLHGTWFCSHLHWSHRHYLFTPSKWLWTGKWTFYWRCCIHLTAPEGEMTGTHCGSTASFICKKREEETMDFHIFHGYYLIGYAKDTKAVIHKSLSEAFQHCRLERTLCTGVQKMTNDYKTFLARRLVLISGSSANLYTAYLKSACTPGYYGSRCSMICSCNGTKNCNPLTGQCAENEQCNEDYLITGCEKGVINLKCPDPGWWFWRGYCYFIPPVKDRTWEQAKTFCLAYHDTKLMPLPDSEEEKILLASMLKDNAWIGSAVKKAKDTANFDEIYSKALSTCPQMNSNGTIKYVECSSLAAWVCKRSVDAQMFWKYPGWILILPLGNKMYNHKEHAESACLLEEKCTGITYWKEKYVPVSGVELVLPISKHDATYIKTACSEGHYGAYCQKRCPDCPEDRPCNRLLGECAGEVTCLEKDYLTRCEIRLKSKFCYYQWVYFNEYCYYISTYGQINQSDAMYMCSQYKTAQLLHLSSNEEEEWLTKIISKTIWIRSVSPSFHPKIFPVQSQVTMFRSVIDIEELCIQLDPSIERLIATPCSHNASWVCKAPLASEPVDAPEKWWMSLVSSLSVTIVVLVVTVFVTYKYGFWVTEVANEVKPQSL